MADPASRPDDIPNATLISPPDRPTMVRYVVMAVATSSSVLLYLDRVCISTVQGSIKEELGLSDEQMAFVLGSFFLPYALAQVPSGWFSDRFGARGMLTFYVLAWSLCTAMLGIATGFAMVLAMRMALGVAQAGAYPTSGALLRRWVPFSQRGMASSVVAFGGRMGGAAAPVLTVAMVGILGGWRSVMVLYGAAGCFVAAAFWFYFRERPVDHPGCNEAERRLISGGALAPGLAKPRAAGEERRAALHTLRRLVASPSMWLMCLSQWGTNVGWVFLITWSPRYLSEHHGVADEQLGVMQSVPLFVGWFGMLAGGPLTDAAVRRLGLRWGRSLPMSASRFMAASAYVGCLFLPSPWLATAALAFVAFSTDLGTGPTWAFAQDVGGKHVGAVLGWGNMFGNLGAFMSPVILQSVISRWDINGDWNEPLVVCALGFVLSGLAALGIDASKPIGASDQD